ncbi:MAG: response regulator [Pseudobdellovibrionaceae bacterium]|nr:MAG: response regulator [Pseudobdellovibrionaceae bacterium]
MKEVRKSKAPRRGLLCNRRVLEPLTLAMASIPPLVLVLLRIDPSANEYLLGAVSAVSILSFIACFLLIRSSFNSMREQEQELKSTDDRLNLALADSHRFIVDMIVQLRRPLNGILGMVQVNQIDFDDDSARVNLKEFTEVADYCCRHMMDQLEHIQFHSELESGQITFSFKPTTLGHLLEESVSDARGLFSSENIEVNTVVDFNTPQDVTLPADAIQMVLTDLTKNAFRYTEKGQIRLRAEIDPKREDHILFSVRDTGVGMTEQRKQQILSDLSKVRSSRQWHERSMGLGLATVSSVLRNINAHIDLQTEVGFGTTWWISVPFKPVLSKRLTDQSADRFSIPDNEPSLSGDSHRQAPVRETPVYPKHLAPSEAKTNRILVVDDEVFARKVIGEMLKRFGHSFDVAENGQQALEMVSKNSYDLVLMDLQMPVMDGIEASTRILGQKNKPRPHIVATTSHARAADKRLCDEIGMDGFLSKPIDIELLRTVVNQFVSSSEISLRAEPSPHSPSLESSNIDDTVTELFDRMKIYEYSGQNLALCINFVEISSESNLELMKDLIAAVGQLDNKKIQFCSHKIKGNLQFLACEQGADLAQKIYILAENGQDVVSNKQQLIHLVQQLNDIVQQGTRLSFDDLGLHSA